MNIICLLKGHKYQHFHLVKLKGKYVADKNICTRCRKTKMNKLTEEQKKRFNSQKRNWEIYGSLGMGIAYPKLEQFLADEFENATKQARIETAERIAKILDGKGFIDYLDIEEIINENKE